jgi:orotate phosphoribosyltransferase
VRHPAAGEGADIRGRRVLVVEDVVTSGGQVVRSAADLRGLGATVDAALCVIDREEGGRAALATAGIALHALLTRGDLDGASSASRRRRTSRCPPGHDK